MKDIIILGVRIKQLSDLELENIIHSYLKQNRAQQIVTPNPEIILSAQTDEELFYIINSAPLQLPDGFGLSLASLSFAQYLKRHTGADLTEFLIKVTQKQDKKIAFWLEKNGLSQKSDLKNILNKKYPHLKFGIQSIDKDNIKPDDLKTLQEFNPDIWLVNFGSPWQEKTIYHRKDKVPNLKIAVGVGGAIDFITNKISRAPYLLRFFGLEWLWRLIQQPRKRAKRIYRAVIIFPWKFFKWRFIKPFFYRPNVACLLYRKENDTYKILLVERRQEAGHWQLPQGGTDGLPIEMAGAKELREELNTDNFKIRAKYPFLYKYHFHNSISKYQVKSKDVAGYKGQKQALVIAEFLGQDNEIKVNFWEHSAWQWVDYKEVLNIVHPRRKKAMQIYLEKFKSFINK